MSSIDKQLESCVKESLFAFLQKNIGGISHGTIDDIVLSYVVSILEGLESDALDYKESFDVDDFIEMMGAYFPGFTNIDSSVVCEWLFSLMNQLSDIKSEALNQPQVDVASSVQINYKCFKEHKPLQSYIHLYLTPTEKTKCASTGISPNPANSEAKTQSDEELQIQRLQEIFPNVCVLEFTRSLAIANGDTEQAVQLIMHRLESHEDLGMAHSRSGGRRSRNDRELDDKELKESILNRYAYVDKAEDERDHKPSAPKTEPKKLIRYRDNKVVSIKGERFSEVKSDEDEAAAATKKATTINLKPARQYRFH